MHRCKLHDSGAADVLTIENSRSGDYMIKALASFGYKRDLGVSRSPDTPFSTSRAPFLVTEIATPTLPVATGPSIGGQCDVLFALNAHTAL